MARKSTKRRTVKRRVTRSTRKPSVPKKEETYKAPSYEEIKSKAREASPDEVTYMGWTYSAWINLILVIAVILIVGILLGVGNLIQKTAQQTKTPVISAQQYGQITGVSEDYVKERVTKVLDIIAGPNSYNITSIVKEHGNWRVNLDVMTPQGVQKGAVFVSLDGKQMYFRYMDVDQFLAQYENATIVGQATMSQ